MNEDNPQVLFEKAKAYFLQANENGDSLYDVLSEVIQYMQENLDPSSLSGKEINFSRLLENLQEDSFLCEELVQPATYQNLWTQNQPNVKLLERENITRELFYKRIQQRKLDDLALQEEVERKRKEAEERAKETDGEEQEEEEEEEENVKLSRHYLYSSVTGITDVMEDVSWFEIAGIGLPKEECYKISLSMLSLQKEKKLERLRFFGKIFGSEKNYIIVESEHIPFPTTLMLELKQDQFVQPPKRYNEKQLNTLPAENAGEGTNKYTYWVCNNVGESWIQLPDVTPQQIMTARLIKKQFSGNLTKAINSYPPFPGNECNYLRAQISRIAAATLAAPSIFAEFEVPEPEEDEDGKLKPVPKYPELQIKEREFESMKDLLSLEHWQHLGHYIRSIGRCTRYKPKSANEEEDVEEEEEGPDVVERLRSLKDDADIILPGLKKLPKKKKANNDEEDEDEEDEDEEEDGEDDENDELKGWRQLKKIPSWTVRQYNKLYSNSFSVIILRSVRWPGAFSYCTNMGMKFGNVYIGNGHKETFGAFTPLMAPTVQTEMKDLEEKKDPSARNEKRVLAGDEPLDEDAKQDDANTNTDDEASDEEDDEEDDD